MFGRTKPIDDPELGTLQRSRGAWRGTIHLAPHGEIALSVPGSRSQPDPEAVALARTIPSEYERCRDAIADALAEHRATTLGENDPIEDDPVENEPAPSSAAVITLDRTSTIQLAYRVDWDDDHTLGACLRDGQLIELNGSILES